MKAGDWIYIHDVMATDYGMFTEGKQYQIQRIDNDLHYIQTDNGDIYGVLEYLFGMKRITPVIPQSDSPLWSL